MSKALPQIEFNPWSPSKASLAGQCGLAFQRRYIEKIPSGPSGAPAQIGITVHHAQELVLLDTPVKEAMVTAIADNEQNLTSGDIESVEGFTHAVIKFKKRIDALKLKHPVEEVLIEQKWAMTPEFEPCDFGDKQGLIRGIVDFALVFKNKNVVVIDHKTGKVKKLSEFGTQLDFYTLMALAHYPDVKGVQCAIHFVKTEELTWAAPTKPSKIRSVLQPWLLKYLSQKSSVASQGTARTGYYCRWCDYKDICPAWVTDGESG